jgi:hypothetical protein
MAAPQGNCNFGDTCAKEDTQLPAGTHILCDVCTARHSSSILKGSQKEIEYKPVAVYKLVLIWLLVSM